MDLPGRSKAEFTKAVSNLGPVNTTRTVATGANFFEFQERGAHCSQLLKRRATTESGKLAPSLRVAAQIGPYFVLALDGGVATAFGLGSRLAQFSLATPSALVC